MNYQPLELNQSALQDFLDCPRRFELRYLNDTAWPAAQGSPLTKFEGLTELGNSFHLLCHQFFLGIDPDLLTASIKEPRLLELWESFLPYGSSFLSLPHATEQILRIPFNDHFLTAKYDLIAQQSESSYLIIDWKTARAKPDRTSLANRVQTYLYPFIFSKAVSDIFPASDQSEISITMQYYYPLSSASEEIFSHSQAEQIAAQDRIADLIAQIEKYLETSSEFPLTVNQENCRFCLYRSYCERGYDTSPLPLGLELENEDLSNLHFDLDLIKEIDY